MPFVLSQLHSLILIEGVILNPNPSFSYPKRQGRHYTTSPHSRPALAPTLDFSGHLPSRSLHSSPPDLTYPQSLSTRPRRSRHNLGRDSGFPFLHHLHCRPLLLSRPRSARHVIDNFPGLSFRRAKLTTTHPSSK